MLTYLLAHEWAHTPHSSFSHVQKGDVLLSINGVSLVGRTHQEAIQTIKSMTPAATIRMELIQVGTHTEVFRPQTRYMAVPAVSLPLALRDCMYRWFSWSMASLLEGKSRGLRSVQLCAKYKQGRSVLNPYH